MTLLYGLLFAGALLIGLAWLFARMKTQKAAQSLRVVLGLLGLILGAALTLRGMGVAGVPLATAALGLLAVALRGGPRAQGGPGAGSAPRSSSGAMSRKEAASILGVSETASEEEIRAAHRELMKKVHPDAGGNDALAAKVQEARDTLLGR